MDGAHRIGLRRLLNEIGAEHDLPATNENPVDARFVGLRRFGGDELADDLIEIIHRRLGQWGDDTLASVLYDQLYELGLNIEEHAEHSGFLMAQWYPAKSQLDIGVADPGVGIRASLGAAGYSFSTDVEAIHAAAESRASRKGRYGGAGLISMQKAAKTYRGSLTVSSGQGRVTYSRRGVLPGAGGFWQGTAIDLNYTWR